MSTNTMNPVHLTEATTIIETPGRRVRAAVAARVDSYTSRPVAPGARREEILQDVKPLTAVAAIALAASAAHAGMNATGADLEIALSTAVAAFATAVVLGFVARRRLLSAKRRTRAYALLAGAASWTAAVMATGPTEGMWFLLGLLAVGATLWWRDGWKLGYNWAPQDMPARAEKRVDVYGPRWAENLNGSGHPLDGTSLTDWSPIEGGSRYTLRVVPGKHTLRAVEGLTDLIRSGLRIRRHHKMLIEEHPALDAPMLQLTVIDRSPVSGGVSFPPRGGMNADGTINIGPYEDGEGVATYKLYSRNRIHNGVIAGGTGAGKSRLIENIAMSAGLSEEWPTAVWYADGQEGQSSPLLVEHADYSATSPERIVELLEEAVRVIRVHGQENRAARRQGFTPTPERPGLLVILDECKLVLSKNNNPDLYLRTQMLAARIATTGNKAGVGLLLAGQEATLPTFGATGEFPAAIRNNVKGGNGVLMRTDEAVAENIFKVKLDTHLMPDDGGWAYIAGKVGSRHAMFRGYWDDDEITRARMERIRWRTVSPLVALDLSTSYRDRKLATEETIEADLAEVEARRRRYEALRRGEQIEESAPISIDDERTDKILAAVQQEEGRTSPFTSLVLASPFLIARAVKVGEPARSAGEDRVLNALAAGHTGWKEIAADAGFGRDMTYRYLNQLKDKGMVTKSHGYWQLAERAA